MAISSTGTQDPAVQSENSATISNTSTTETAGCKSPRRQNISREPSSNNSTISNLQQDGEHLSPESDPKQEAKKMRKGSKSSLSCDAATVDNDVTDSTNTTSDSSVDDNHKNDEKEEVYNKSDHESKRKSQDLKTKNDSSAKNGDTDAEYAT